MSRLLVCLSFFALTAAGCQSGGGGGMGGSGRSNAGIHGGGESSSPINPAEEQAYKRALLKCYKTGGSRIVKIEGKLRCY